MRRCFPLLALAFLLTMHACDAGKPSPDAADAADAQEVDVAVDTSPDLSADTAEDTGTDTAALDSEADTAPDADDVALDTEADQADTVTATCADRAAAFDDGEPIAIPLDGQAIVRGTRDAQHDLAYVIDTGAQITSYDIDLTAGSTGYFNVAQLDLGTTLLCDVTGKGRDLAVAEQYIGVGIDALLGQTALKSMYTFIDYAGARAWFYQTDPAVAPPGMDTVAPVDLAYELQNELPVAQISLGNGIVLPLLTDTGSGVTVITQSYFDAAEVAYGAALPRLTGYVWATNYGTDDSFVTRLPELHVGEVTIAGEAAVVIPEDNHLRALLEANGVFVEGFLGYPVYRHFLTSIRGPESMMRLWRYPNDDHLAADEWHRVGIELLGLPDGPSVEMVFQPSDAATQGVQRGDVLTHIDGADVAGLELDAVRRLLRGTPGDTVALTLVRSGETAPLVLNVLIDDLLPPL